MACRHLPDIDGSVSAGDDNVVILDSPIQITNWEGVSRKEVQPTESRRKKGKKKTIFLTEANTKKNAGRPLTSSCPPGR